MLTREEVLHHALALPPADRELVAAALEDSLAAGPDPVESLVGDEFLQELQRRSAAYRSGQGRARPATEVMAELFQRQADESSS